MNTWCSLAVLGGPVDIDPAHPQGVRMAQFFFLKRRKSIKSRRRQLCRREETGFSSFGRFRSTHVDVFHLFFWQGADPLIEHVRRLLRNIFVLFAVWRPTKRLAFRPFICPTARLASVSNGTECVGGPLNRTGAAVWSAASGHPLRAVMRMGAYVTSTSWSMETIRVSFVHFLLFMLRHLLQHFFVFLMVWRRWVW